MALGEWDNTPVIRADRPDVRMKIEDEVSPGFVPTMAAAMRQSNPIGSFIANETFQDGLDPWEIEDGFNTLDYVRKTYGDAFESEHGDRFLEVFNRPYADALKRQIDMETDDRKTLAAAGFGGVMADLFASALDPTNLLPGGAAVKSVRTGKAFVGSALRVGSAGALAAGVSEVALQATQETRTTGESVMAIGGGAILAGVIGGTIGSVVSRAERRALSARLSADLNAPAHADELVDPADGIRQWVSDVKAATEADDGRAIRGGDDVLASEGKAASGGAAAVPRQTIDDLTIAGVAARRTAKETAFLNPGLRLFNSPSVAARGIAEQMGEWTLYLKKNFGANARPTEQAVESLVERYMGGVATVTRQVNGELFPTYRKGGGTMNREAFNREVGKAMRRGDEHQIPEVKAAAKEYRKRVVEPVLQRAIEVGLLPKNTSTGTAASYFPRLWNRQRLVAEEGAFKSVAAGWMGEELDRVIEIQRRKLAKLEENIRREVDDLEMAALRREEELQRRETGGEADIGAFNEDAGADVTEADVLRMIRTVRTASLPKVETLKDWIARQGGLYDPGGDVARLEYRRPGFIRKTRRSLHAVAADQGGLGLDDAARAAWEDGFFPNHVERPTPNDLLDALSDDIAGNPVVREADYEAARVIREHAAIEEALTRMGVDLDRPRFATSEALRDVLHKVNAALRAADQDRIAALRRKLADARSRHDFDVEAFTGIERPTTIQEAVDAVFDKLTGRAGDTMPALRNVIPTRCGPLKERSFGIPDELVEQWLENDADMVMRRHARIGGAEVELADKFGSPDMADALAELASDYRGLRDAVGRDAKLPPDQRAAALKSLDKRERADRGDVEAVRDMLRGAHNAHFEGKVWARSLNAIQIMTYMAALGGVVVSSLTEPFRLMILHGVGRTMRDGVGPMISNLKAVQMSRADARLAGALIERDLATHLTTWSELADPYAARSPAERYLEHAARLFSKWGNGIVFWTDFMKTLDSNIAQRRILDGVRSWQGMDEAERAFLLQLGIDDARARHIAEQFAKHGEMQGEIPVANIDRWDDTGAGRAAYRAYSAAVTKNARTAVVMAGKLDKPLFMSHPLGRAVTQFQSYAMAAHQRVFLRTLQGVEVGVDGGRAGAAAGIAAMISMGMMIYYLKAVEANREVSDNPGVWLAEGLDRSGLVTLFFAANNAVEKNLNAGAYGALASLFPDGSQKNLASRYVNRSALSSLAGASAGFIERLVQVLRAARKGDLTEGDVNAIVRLTPISTLPIVRSLMEYHAKPAIYGAVAD